MREAIPYGRIDITVTPKQGEKRTTTHDNRRKRDVHIDVNPHPTSNSSRMCRAGLCTNLYQKGHTVKPTNLQEATGETEVCVRRVGIPGVRGWKDRCTSTGGELDGASTRWTKVHKLSWSMAIGGQVSVYRPDGRPRLTV